MKAIEFFHGRFIKNLIVIVLCLSFCFPQIIYSQSQNQATTVKYDVIIVPGFPFKEKGWNWIMKTRIQWAKVLYDRGLAKKVMFSGGAVYTPYCESIIMGLYAEIIGIPAKDILLETRAEHGVENVYFSYLQARALGYRKIALATDPFQSWFLKKFIKDKIDGNIDLLPINYRDLPRSDSDSINPRIDYKLAYQVQFISILDRDTRMERKSRSHGDNLDKIDNRTILFYNKTLTSVK